ncbi:GDSL esterase/lipase [Glycine max]|nr:GDSL esterase/lipase [Glycine max]
MTLKHRLSTSENLLVSIQEKIKWADAMSEIEKKRRKDVEEKVQELKSVIKVAEAYGMPMWLAYLNLIEGQDIKKECDNYFTNALFLVGEISGNDLSAIIPYINITKLCQMVPPIVEAIINTTSELIEEGAIKLVVPKNFLIGCNSVVLATLNSDKKDDYDQFGCLKTYNTFIEYYNEQIKKAIETLRQKYSYFDNYGATKRLFQAPQQYGGFKTKTFRVCCEKSEPYNISLQIAYGSPATIVSSNPSKYVNRDEPHFIEATYRLIAKGLVEGSFANPSLKSLPFKIV